MSICEKFFDAFFCKHGFVVTGMGRELLDLVSEEFCESTGYHSWDIRHAVITGFVITPNNEAIFHNRPDFDTYMCCTYEVLNIPVEDVTAFLDNGGIDTFLAKARLAFLI